MKYTFILTTLFLFSYSFANERVQNGWQIPADNSLARSIARFQSASGSCTATFISKYFLLTAAHCTYKASASSSKILVRDASGTWRSTKIKRLITHPQFAIQSGTSAGTYVKNDIALIEITSAFSFPINIIAIGNTSEYTSQENQVRIYGYGKSSSAGGSGTLRWGYMTAIVEPVDLFHGVKGLLMVPEATQALCPGDSGGPVMKISNSRRYLIGVNSLSNGCKNANSVTSIAIIVTQHMSWLRQYVSGI
jgi:serine protease